MRKLISRVVVVGLIGIFGWNTYSLSQLKEQVKSQSIAKLKEQDYKEPIVEEESHSSGDKKEKPYLLFLDN